MNPVVHTMMEHLQRAGARWVEDLVNHVGTGTKMEAAVWVDRASLAVTEGKPPDEAAQGQEFTVSGKWEAHVRKDKFHLGRVYDRIWGDDERPYGFFSIRIRCLDNQVAEKPRLDITVEDPDEEPKQYALRYAEELIGSKVAEVFG